VAVEQIFPFGGYVRAGVGFRARHLVLTAEGSALATVVYREDGEGIGFTSSAFALGLGAVW
jgi:hypothetical protein